MSAIRSVVVSAVLALVAGQGVEPRPQDAVTAILDAFDRYEVVGMNAAHSNERQDDLILALVQAPAFASKVNDVVIECGQTQFQTLADRYVAGENVSLDDVRQVWRSTSLRMCALSGFNDRLFPAVRAVNEHLPAGKRIRVLLGEPTAGNRDSFITTLMTTEVLAKQRKALMLFGVGHLYHVDGTAVSAYEKVYPGRTYVIQTHQGFAPFIDLERGHELEARMREWPVPSIAPLKGTWIADLDLPYFLWPFTKGLAGKSITDLADAYLYLGPGGSLTYERTPDFILNDPAYIGDISRRLGPVNVESLRRRNENRALYDASDIAEAHQFAPGAACVGSYADTRDGLPIVEVDFRKGVLSGRMPGSIDWTPLTRGDQPSVYTMPAPSGALRLEFERSAGTIQRLTLDLGGTKPTRILVRATAGRRLQWKSID